MMKCGAQDQSGAAEAAPRWVILAVSAVILLALLALAGCNAVYGLGTDLQSLSDLTQTQLIVDNPAND